MVGGRLSVVFDSLAGGLEPGGHGRAQEASVVMFLVLSLGLAVFEGEVYWAPAAATPTRTGRLQIPHGSPPVPPAEIRDAQQAVRVLIGGVSFHVIGKDQGRGAGQSARQVVNPLATAVTSLARLLSHGRKDVGQGCDILPGSDGRAPVLSQPPLGTPAQVKSHLGVPERPYGAALRAECSHASAYKAPSRSA
jgi:hypothetical protein